MMQVTPSEAGLKKALRQQKMRDQDRERAMFKDAAYRVSLEAALQRQVALSDLEQRQQAEAELQHLSDVFERRVDRIGEAHAEAAMYMQQQREARVAQERRLAELNQRQEERFQSALSAVKAQHGAARTQAEAVQQRRAQILRAERDKAQAFAAEQADRAQAQKRRQTDTSRQELERRKRSPNGMAMDFRHTRLHEGVGPPPSVPPLAVPAVVAPPLPPVPDPVLSAEELQHRADMEKRRREAAAVEAEIRARERFLAAQAKLRADAQRQAVEAELAEMAAQRLQAKKQALAAHRLRLRDQRKQQELQRVFEDNFLPDKGSLDDDLAPRALPAFLQRSAPTAAPAPAAVLAQPVPAARMTGAIDTLPRALGVRTAAAPPQQLPNPAEVAGMPRWSKGRTAPLGGRATPPPPLPAAWAPITALAPQPPPPLKEEAAVQTDPELLALPQQPDGPHSHAVDAPSPEARPGPARQLAWSEPATSDEAMPASAGAAGRPPPPSPASVTGGLQSGGDTRRPATRAQTATRTPPTPLPSPLTDMDLGGLQLGDGDDEVDAWGEEEVDRELARMKRELGIEESDLRSPASSIDSGVSVPAFLRDAAARTAARQTATDAAARSVAVPRAPPAPAPATGPAPAPSAAFPRHPSSPAPSQPEAAGPSVGPARDPSAPARFADTGVVRPQHVSGADVAATAAAALDALGASVPLAGRSSPPMARLLHGPHAQAPRVPVAAAANSPADTLDSSILRLLDTPSSTGTPASSGAPPRPPPSTGTAGRRPGGGATATTLGRFPSHTPDSTTSLPSDLDDVLLLTELDWEELEGLAGLRSAGGRVDAGTAGPSAGASTATADPTAGKPVGGAATPKWAVGATGGASGGDAGSPSSSTLSGISGISDDSLRRLVAQGILPPEVATLLAATPPSAAIVGTATGLPPSSSAAVEAGPAAELSAAPGRATASRPHLVSAAGRQTATVPAAAAAAASPTISSSSLSELASLLGPLGIAMPGSLVAVASDTTSLSSHQAGSSLSSLSAHAAALAAAGTSSKLGPGHGNAGGAAPKPAARGLFSIPESGAALPNPLSVGAMGLSGLTGLHGSVAAAPRQPVQASGLLSEPVRLTLADLNRQLLASVGGRSLARPGAGSPGGASPGGPPRPARPGPLIITSGGGAFGTELGIQPLQPPPALSPPRLHHPPPSPLHPPQQQRQEQLTSGGGSRAGAGAGAVPPASVSVSLSDTSVSSMSSLSLSPTKPPHYRGSAAPQPASGPGETGQPAATGIGAGAEPGAAPATVTAEPRGTTSRPANRALPAGRLAAGAPPSACEPSKRSSPYDLYDKEAARLAELMATITASLRQSAEAVARAGSSSSSSASRMVASPSVSSTTASASAATPGLDNRHWQAQQQHAATGAQAVVAAPPPSASPSSTSLPSSSSWTVSLGSQSPVAAMLRNARAAAATAAMAATAGAPLTSQRLGDGAATRPRDAQTHAKGQGLVQPEPSARMLTYQKGGAAASARTTLGIPGIHSATAAVISGPGASIDTTSITTDSAAASSTPSGLSSVLELLRQGPPGPETRSSPSGAGVPLSRLGPPASPPPPLAPEAAASPVPSLSSPPTPYSPILSDSSYDSLSPPSTSPGLLAAAAAAGGAAGMQLQPQTKPVASAGGAGGPRASLTLSLSSSDGISSVAEMIAGVLSQRAHGGGGGGPQPPLVQPLQPPKLPPQTHGQQLQQPPNDDRSVETLSLEPASDAGAALDRGPAGQGTGAAATDAAGDAAAATSDGSSPSHGSSSRPGAEVWASLTGQTLAEALAGLASSSGRYEDLLRSSLALSISSLNSGASLEDDVDSQSLQGTLAPSDFREMVLGDFTAREAREEQEGRGEEDPAAEAELPSSRTLPPSPPSVGVEAPWERRDSRPEAGGPVVSAESSGPSVGSEVETDAGRRWRAGEQTFADSDSARPPTEAEARLSGKEFASVTSPRQRQEQEQLPAGRVVSALELLAQADAALARVTSGMAPGPARQEPPAEPEAEPEAQLGAEGMLPLPALSVPSGRPGELPARVSAAPVSAATTAVPPPAVTVAPASSLELRSSADSDEFESVMAALMQDIQRGLATLQAPPLQLPPPQQQQRPLQMDPEEEIQQPPGRREPEIGLRGAAPRTGAALGSPKLRGGGDEAGLPAMAAPHAAMAAGAHGMGWEENVDAPGPGRYASSSSSSADDDVLWWPTTASGGAEGGRGLEGQEPGAVQPAAEAAAVEQQQQQEEEEEYLLASGRQLLQMPTLSRGFADEPARSARDSDAGSLRRESSTATAGRRRISNASAASSGAGSSVTLAPISHGAPASIHGATAPQSSTAAAAATVNDSGTYSFLQAPRAASAARTPPSVHSGAESYSQAPSGSSNSQSVSTVSSLDSLTNALAQYPVFGGGNESPLGSQSPVSSDDGGGAAAAGAGAGEPYAGEVAEVETERQQLQPPLPIQYEPLQPVAAPTPHGSMEQEPWQGAWDPPSPQRPAVSVSSAAGTAAAALLGLRAVQTVAAAPGPLPPAPSPSGPFSREASEALSGNPSGSSVHGRDSFDDGRGVGGPGLVSRVAGAAVTPAGLYGAALDDRQLAHGQRQPAEHAETEREPEPEPQTPVRWTPPASAPSQEEHLRDVAMPAGSSEGHEQPDQESSQEQLQQQQLSPSLRRQILGLQPLTLEIPNAASDPRAAGGGGGAANAALRIGMVGGAGAGVSAVVSTAATDTGGGSDRAEEAPLPQTPVQVRSGLAPEGPQARGMSRGPEEGGARRSSGGGSAGYAGALSDELLADLLLWTVSDFFSSPGSGSGGEG